MSASDGSVCLIDLIISPQWVAWRNEMRADKVTKVPYCSPGRKAESNEPATWLPHDQAVLVAEAIGGGIGIELGPCGYRWLVGVDLDSCRDPATGVIESWAMEVIQRLASYTEVSPSSTGVKVFGLVNPEEVQALRRLMGTDHGRQFKRSNGSAHPPAIELYTSNRYFAVTWEGLEDAPADLRIIPLDDLRWLIDHAGPAFSGKVNATHSGAAHDGVGDDSILLRLNIAARHNRLIDNALRNAATMSGGSRSEGPFGLGAALKRAGWSYADTKAALLACPITREWATEKTLSEGDRQFQRIWSRATEDEARQEGSPGAAAATGDAKANDFPNLGTTRKSIQLPPLLSLADFMATFQTPDYIVDGVIQRGRLYALTSPTGHGKTAVAQYIGDMVAAGRNIGNIEVTQGPVIFLAGENPDDLCCRMHAACQIHGIDPAKAPMHVMPGNFPLSEAAAQELKDRINTSGINPVLIIFDTAASFFPGDDDNANVPMGAYARNLRVLTTCEGRPAVLVPTHPIKNPDKDNLLPRGGGAFLNELDGNLTLWADTMGESAALHWQGKLRGADFQPVSFALQQVKIISLLDQRGRPIVSIVATLQTTAQAEDAARQAHSDEDTVLELLRRHPGISLRDIGLNAGWVTPAGSAAVSKVHRLMKALQRDKLVKLHRGKWCLTDAGERETETK